jgi:hypothetical protein
MKGRTMNEVSQISFNPGTAICLAFALALIISTFANKRLIPVFMLLLLLAVFSQILFGPIGPEVIAIVWPPLLYNVVHHPERDRKNAGKMRK